MPNLPRDCGSSASDFKTACDKACANADDTKSTWSNRNGEITCSCACASADAKKAPGAIVAMVVLGLVLLVAAGLITASVLRKHKK